MNSGKTVFSQIMDHLPPYEFQKCVQRYKGNYKVKSFSCRDQFLCMAFAQLTFRESLRDIEACLRSSKSKLYHMGIRGTVSRNTLSNANQKRDYRIYRDLGHTLIKTARALYAHDPLGIQLEHTVYAFDSTTIDLCLSLFPWAEFRKRKGAVKLHTLLDLRGNIPVNVMVTHGRTHDVIMLDRLNFEAGAFYIMDRGYLDYARLYRLHQASAFFVIRAKKNLQFKQVYSRPVDKKTGLRCDQTVKLTGFYSQEGYPEHLRRIVFFDKENNMRLVFLTNNFLLPPLTIAELYKYRWKVELFFKWIKQHLRIRTFFGTSKNAVKTQVWIAISVYVLVAIVKKRLKLEQSLYTILQILSVTVFEKVPIFQLFTDIDFKEQNVSLCKQLDLFD